MTKKKSEAKQVSLGRYRVQFDFNYSGTKGTEPKGESQTVPDMNLTVRQLLDNHTRGITGNVSSKEPFYFETEVPTIKDMTDVKKYKDYLQRKLKDTEEFIAEELEEKAYQKELEAEREYQKQKRSPGKQLDLLEESEKP